MKHPIVYPGQTLPENFHRILGHYHRQAIAHLESHTRPDHHIHEARLCFKRIRSLLRLGRYGMEEGHYRALNTFYRDLGRNLSAARDLAVMAAALEPLIRTRRHQAARDFLVRVRREWLARRSRLMEEKGLDNARETVLRTLHESGHVTEQPLTDPGPITFAGTGLDVYFRGMGRVYKAGSKLYVSCVADPADHSLHEWRKQVKHLWYQAVMLNRTWPAMMKAWAKEWQALSVILGEHNDLVLVEQGLRESGKWSGHHRERSAVCRSIRRQKSKLVKKAMEAGERLFSMDPATIRKVLSGFTGTSH